MIGIFCGKDDEKTLDGANAVSRELKKRGEKVLIKNENDYLDGGLSTVDLLIVFGGDGSVLKAVKATGDKTPVVALNTGNLGFLTLFDEVDVSEFADAVVNKTITFSPRTLLKVVYDGGETLCLNDAVLIKDYVVDRTGGCVKIKLFIDGKFVDSYVSDGLIISTPTGSTAYALSSGGPVITPDLEAFEAVPVCAHSLHARPIVYSTKSTAVAEIDENGKSCALYADGGFVKTVFPGEKITLKKSEIKAFIAIDDAKFFDKLNKKLNYWSITGDYKNE